MKKKLGNDGGLEGVGGLKFLYKEKKHRWGDFETSTSLGHLNLAAILTLFNQYVHKFQQHQNRNKTLITIYIQNEIPAINVFSIDLMCASISIGIVAFPSCDTQRVHSSKLIDRLEIIQRSGVQLPERLVPLITIGAQLKTHLKPLEHHSAMVLKGLKGPPLYRVTRSARTFEVNASREIFSKSY